MFPQDLPFASLTDSFNITDLETMAQYNQNVSDWISGKKQLTIIVILTHNKLIADKINNIKHSIINEQKLKMTEHEIFGKVAF